MSDITTRSGYHGGEVLRRAPERAGEFVTFASLASIKQSVSDSLSIAHLPR